MPYLIPSLYAGILVPFSLVLKAFLCLVFVLKDVWSFRARLVHGERINL